MSGETPSPVDAQRSEEEKAEIAKILALDVEKFPQYRQNALFSWQRDASRYSLHALQEAIKKGTLQVSDFTHVIDFGAGGGGPTFMVDQICQITGGRVEAVEMNPEQITTLRQVVPSVPIHEGNGIEMLKGMNGDTTLITAFTFGPDEGGELFMSLAEASANALNEQGKLLVYSDNRTLAGILTRVVSSHIAPEDVSIIPQTNHGDTYKFSPTTLIFSKQGCASIK